MIQAGTRSAQRIQAGPYARRSSDSSQRTRMAVPPAYSASAAATVGGAPTNPPVPRIMPSIAR